MTLDGESSGLGGMTPLVSTEEAHEAALSMSLRMDLILTIYRKIVVGGWLGIMCLCCVCGSRRATLSACLSPGDLDGLSLEMG